MVECILALVTDSLPFEYEAYSSVIVKCDWTLFWVYTVASQTIEVLHEELRDAIGICLTSPNQSDCDSVLKRVILFMMINPSEPKLNAKLEDLC